MPHAHTDLIDSRYQPLMKIGSGGMGEIYRVRDLITGDEVALKRVTVAGDKLSFQTMSGDMDFRLALAQEFRILATVRHPHIISVLDYGFSEDKMPYYTMDLLDDPHNIVSYASTLPFEAKVRLLIQVSQALTYLHRRGIIHRDLKPENVLVVNDNARVLDFGLAVQAEHLRSDGDELIAGTLGYMAPELLASQPPSEKSDLYALGVIAYEMLVGEHPFKLNNPSQLMMDILYSEVYVELDGTNTEIETIIKRLMEKEPAERYDDANQVTQALANAIGFESMADDVSIRDSFIQAARFVGRKEESKLLNKALQRIFPRIGESTQGSAWLLGGESGVGKSRLLDELRASAMVEGALVLQGQSASEGLVYQVWRGIMRRLVLATDIDDLELSILRDVVPDIEQLVGREIPPASALRGKSAVQRLALTIVSILRRQERPMVLLLEDLHWADESIDIVQEVLKVVDELPVLVVGTFRNDEMPELPEQLPEMQIMELERLSDREIRDLSVSIMGEQVGGNPNVLELLKRETEGNVFFLVEVVRVLAEDAGSLTEIGAKTLPASVFSGSMRTVIERRLRRVPIDAHPMLRLAAVFGREIDLKILREIDPYMNIDNWLMVCSNAAILEIAGGTWRFAHDRIRDGILDALDPHQRPKLNEMVAEAIEAIYPNDQSYAQHLMDMWSIVGNEEKEAQYALIAAQVAFTVSDYSDALRYLERAIEIHGENTPAEVFITQGDVYYHMGLFDKAQERLRLALSRVMSDDARSTVLAVMADMSIETGNYYRAERMLLEAEPIARDNASQMTLARVLSGMGDANMRQGRLDDAVALFQESRVIARLTDDFTRMLYTMNRLGMIAVLRRDFNDAGQILSEAAFTAHNTKNTEMGMFISCSLGILDLAEGKITAAKQSFEDALRVANDLENHHLQPLFLSYLSIVQIKLGEGLDDPRVRIEMLKQARRNLQDALDIAIDMEMQPLVLHTLIGYAELFHAVGDLQRAKQLLRMVFKHPAYNRELNFQIEEKLDDWKLSMTELVGMADGLDYDTEVELLAISDGIEFDTIDPDETLTTSSVQVHDADTLQALYTIDGSVDLSDRETKALWRSDVQKQVEANKVDVPPEVMRHKPEDETRDLIDPDLPINKQDDDDPSKTL